MMIENSAKALIIEDDKVLLIKNVDKYRVWYCLPGGRQKFSEDLSETLLRECEEEINVRPKIEQLLYVREYIHSKHEFYDNGDDMHKIEFMFKCKLCDSDFNQIMNGTNIDDAQKEIVWLSLNQMENIKIYPKKLNHLKKILELDNTSEVYWGDIL